MNLEQLKRIALDLDRCEHGRHSIDECFGCERGNGERASTGNQHRHVVIGNNYAGKPWTVADLIQAAFEDEAPRGNA